MRTKLDLKQKKVLVVGTGISGIAAAKLLRANHIDFEIYDGNDKLSREDVGSIFGLRDHDGGASGGSAFALLLCGIKPRGADGSAGNRCAAGAGRKNMG